MDSAQHVQEEKNFNLLLADATGSYECTRPLALWQHMTAGAAIIMPQQMGGS